MRLRTLRPLQGIKFAWLPVWTDEGKVWLEWVHFKWNATEFGSYSYRRVRYKTDAFGLKKVDYERECPECEANGRCARHPEKSCTICAGADSPGFYTGCLIKDGHGDGTWDCDGHGHLEPRYATPPDISKCVELRTDGPTPCRYPHCTCMYIGGSTCGGGLSQGALDELERADRLDLPDSRKAALDTQWDQMTRWGR